MKFSVLSRFKKKVLLLILMKKTVSLRDSMNRVRKVHKEVRVMQFEEVKIMQTETFKSGGKDVYLILNEQVQLIMYAITLIMYAITLIMYAITLIMYCREYVYDLPNKMCAILTIFGNNSEIGCTK